MDLKTSLKKNWQIVVLILAIIILLLSLRTDKLVLQLGAQNFKLEIADSSEDKAIGLSGRETLGKNEGMIFSSNEPEEMCMWMKEMKFNLAIIWVENKKVSYIEPDLSPATYPEPYCHRANHVIEINVGDLRSSGLKVGDNINLE